MNDSAIHDWIEKDITTKGCPTMSEGVEDARFLPDNNPLVMYSRSEVLEIKKDCK